MSDKYSSRLAGLLGKINKKQTFAVTISKTTTLYSVPVGMVGNIWRKHEECHKEQIRDEGWLLFMVKYLFFNITRGYQNNPYEIDARMKSEG